MGDAVLDDTQIAELKKKGKLGNIVSIRGVVYPSVNCASRALGVSRSAIHDALDRGRVDEVGLKKNICNSIKVTVNGITYKTIGEAARAFDMNYQYVRKRLMDEAWLARRGWVVEWPNRVPRRPKEKKDE